MVIYAGEYDTQFIKISKIDHNPASQLTKNDEQLLRVAYEQDFHPKTTGFDNLNGEANSKFQKGNGQTQGKIWFYSDASGTENRFSH